MSKFLNFFVAFLVIFVVWTRFTTEETRCPDDEGSLLWKVSTPVDSNCGTATTLNLETEAAKAPVSIDTSSQEVKAGGESESCNQAEAEERWLEAQSEGVVSGASLQDGTPTIHLEESIWREISDTTRVGMASIFQCMIAGPDVTIPKVRFATPANRVLGSFDSIRKRVEMND